MNAVRNQQKGFTIIEVVLVLAIAGLIFLMIFIALPALQRGQRDTARKTEAGTIISAIVTYQGNNRGNTPTTAAQIGQIINGGTGTLDSGTEIQIRATSYSGDKPVTGNSDAPIDSTNDIAAPDEALVYIGYKCGATNNDPLVRGTKRQAAVVVIQESLNGRYCTNL